MVEKIIFVITNAINRIHNRPTYERRAMFIASFLILGTAVFSLWAHHMYNRFGIAFINQPVEVSGQEEVRATAHTEEEGLQSPLAVLRENVLLVRERARELFLAFSSGFRDVSELLKQGDYNKDRIPVAGVGSLQSEKEDDKMPPVVNDVPEVTEPENNTEASTPIDEASQTAAELIEAVAVLETNDSAEPAVVKKDERLEKEEKIENDKEIVFMEEDQLVNKQGIVFDSVSFEETRRSGAASILMTNLAIIRQALRDFVEYLTQ